MKRLILMRHAKSDWAFSEPDIDRPLNLRGQRSARLLGRWLKARGHLPDEALVSAARRTRETWEGLEMDAPMCLVPALYHAEPGTMLDVLGDAAGDSVLMIGHNPGIAECAAMLPAIAPDHPRFADYPTGATLIVDFDSQTWHDLPVGNGQVVDFVVPRELMQK